MRKARWLALAVGCAVATAACPGAADDARPAPEPVRRGATPRTAAHGTNPAPSEPVRIRRPAVVRTVPHDAKAFTEGLEWRGETVLESTGSPAGTGSSLREVDAGTGRVLRRAELPPGLFGEGLTVARGQIWQLTFREHVALVWDPRTFALVRRVGYEGEGWGLCWDAARGRLVMSDGSDRLVFRDPGSFAVLGEQRVQGRPGGGPLRLNELECTGDAVWANAWPTNQVLRIETGTGRVTAALDLGGLHSAQDSVDAAETNGIAAMPGTDLLLVTGKWWPHAYVVEAGQETDGR